MNIGIDLLWVKPGKSGGIESYIRNLIDGFLIYGKDDYKYILFVSKDNVSTFEKYTKNKAFKLEICNVFSENVGRRILWENFNLNRRCINLNINILFIPVYSKPLLNHRKIKYITTIHDIQAMHYPQYFSTMKVLWLKFAWKRCCKTSHKIIAISNFVKQDIIDTFKIQEKKIQVIYNPIVKNNTNGNFKDIEETFKINKKNYYYTVAQLLPHKNLETLLYVIKEIKEKEINVPNTLVISGVGGKDEGRLRLIIEELNLSNNIIITGFVTNEERDLLYKNAAVFLFPSIFEGFGMPPIEAMQLGVPVLTTKCSSIPEVTEGKANYVEDPFAVAQWVKKIREIVKEGDSTNYSFQNYYLENVTKEYLQCFHEVSSYD